jgi:hypothetical protein
MLALQMCINDVIDQLASPEMMNFRNMFGSRITTRPYYVVPVNEHVSETRGLFPVVFPALMGVAAAEMLAAYRPRLMEGPMV